MAEHRIDIQDIFDATNGGLDLILELYPQAEESSRNRNTKFKIHEEKTASVNLYKNSNGIWLVTDFREGGEAKGKNAIDCYMSENGIDFITAINELANKYSIVGADPAKAPKPIVSKQTATSDQDEKSYCYTVKNSFTDKEIETIFPKNALASIGWKKKKADGSIDEEKKKSAYNRIAAVCKKYNFWALENIMYIKNREATVYSATEDYPMFAWIEPLSKTKKFAKLYQPKHVDKGQRFKYAGKKPSDFVHGLKQAEAEFEILKEKNKPVPKYDEEGNEIEQKPIPAQKLPEILYLSGGTDALTAALLGYWVTWPNSETATLTEFQYREMTKIANKVIQMQDIDDTGIKQAHEKAMSNLELQTAELPAVLKEKRDRRGSPCKDLRDYLNHYSVYDFNTIINTALPYRFWDLTPKYSGKGENRIQIGYNYEFNNVHAYNFLSKNGFYRLSSQARKNGYMFIKVDGNIVSEIDSNEVKNFVHSFLNDRRMDTNLRNAMYRTTQLSDSSLSNLPLINLEFNDTGKTEQFFMFPNLTLQITADGFKQFKPGTVKRYIWNDDVLEHHFKLQDESFTIFMDENTGQYDIIINKTNDIFLNYMIQVSRIHWRVELEDRIHKLAATEREEYRVKHKFSIDGPLLTAEEIHEQKQHLINKIFGVGYLMHRFKDPNRPWCIFGMDNNISEDGGSYGGSGKSILFNVALSKILRKRFYIGGRNPKVTENQFIYDGLTEDHRYIYIDDAHEYLNFHFFFDTITGNLKVNPKNSSPFEIHYEKVGKFTITSNYVLRNLDPSVERRILYTVFSDYYHTKGETNNYNESRSPFTDFGKNLFSDFTRDEWNDFYNTMMHSLKFYFTATEKIDPPMSNVNIRNLKSEMGADFEEWATAYFDQHSDHIDTLIVRDEAKKDFDFKYRKGWATQRFSKALRAFCKLNNYELNPKELHNSKSRIIHKTTEKQQQKDGTWTDTGVTVTKEFMYIRTKFDIPLEVNIIPKEVTDVPSPKDAKIETNF